jgi:aryl-alcohol dehydrogenase-like predicted oxidoreductase
MEEVYPADYLRACTEESLRNLGVETIDLLQLHVWNDEWVGQDDWLVTFQNLKEAGKLRFWGISTNDHQPENAIEIVKTGLVDTVQVVYNIFDQRPEDRLFEVCQQQNVGVIVRVPLDEGGLTGAITPASTFDERDFRRHYFGGERKQEVYEHVQQILTDLALTREELPELALRYTLSHPAVSTVIPGMRTIRNAERNTALADGRGLPPEQLQRLKKHRWVRNFYA